MIKGDWLECSTFLVATLKIVGPEEEQNLKTNFQRKKRERFSAFLAKSERTFKCVRE